jgi:hypothetical protein
LVDTDLVWSWQTFTLLYFKADGSVVPCLGVAAGCFGDIGACLARFELKLLVLAVCAIQLNGQTDRVIRTVRIIRTVAIPQ